MTLELVWIAALTAAIGSAVLVAAVWSVLDSYSLYRQYRLDKDREKVSVLRLMMKRSVGRVVLVVLLSMAALIRLSATHLLVTTATYGIFLCILAAQVLVVWFIWIDLKEKLELSKLPPSDAESSRDVGE